MKKISTLFFLLLVTVSMAQISTTRMNDLNVRAKLSEIETILGEKLELSKKENDWLYTTTVNHKGAELHLSFMDYHDELEGTVFQLFLISTDSNSLKTLSNLGVGSSLEDLWKAYKHYNISIWNEWDENLQKFTPEERVFQISDYDAETALFFHIKNNRVYKISVSFFEGC